MTLIANLVITSYKNRGMINLLAIQNNMINPQPGGLFGHDVRALYRHPLSEWLETLEKIRYKPDTFRWFHVHSRRGLPLLIEEYVPKGLVPEPLFPLNQRGVHKVTAYWAHREYPKDRVRPWIMTKEISAGSGFHPILTDSHHYVCQNVVDPPNATGQVLRPGDSAPHAISIPILRQSIGRNHLAPPEASPVQSLQLSPPAESPPHLLTPLPFRSANPRAFSTCPLRRANHDNAHRIHLSPCPDLSLR